jgi:hypothetical protein
MFPGGAEAGMTLRHRKAPLVYLSLAHNAENFGVLSLQYQTSRSHHDVWL